ncbi:TPA: hypothetical protein ACH3X2_005085 [Trebouxia sp. C0005]
MQTSSCCQSLHKGRGLCLASLKKKCAHGNTSFPVQDILENCTRCLLSATREQGQANIAGLGQVFNPHQAAFKQAGGYAKFREGASSMLWIGVACKNTCSVTNKNFDLTCRHSYGGQLYQTAD